MIDAKRRDFWKSRRSTACPQDCYAYLIIYETFWNNLWAKFKLLV